MQGKGYGMPSSHAQFVAFFSTYLTLFLLIRHRPLPSTHPNASPTHTPLPYWQRIGLALIAIASAAAVAQSRVFLNYHKPNQVYIGIGAGVGFAVLWYIATDLARRYGVVDRVLNHPISRYVRLRDLVIYEDLVDAGWERFETRRRERMGTSLSNGSPSKGKKKR